MRFGSMTKPPSSSSTWVVSAPPDFAATESMRGVVHTLAVECNGADRAGDAGALARAPEAQDRSTMGLRSTLLLVVYRPCRDLHVISRLSTNTTGRTLILLGDPPLPVCGMAQSRARPSPRTFRSDAMGQRGSYSRNSCPAESNGERKRWGASRRTARCKPRLAWKRACDSSRKRDHLASRLTASALTIGLQNLRE